MHESGEIGGREWREGGGWITPPGSVASPTSHVFSRVTDYMRIDDVTHPMI